MNTPQWMIEAPAHAPTRARSVRHNRRSTDRAAPKALDVTLAVVAMLATTWAICEVNYLLLR